MSIRFKVILLAILAMSFLLIALLKEYNDMHSDVLHAQKSVDVITKIKKLSEVIHSLQQERGLSGANLVKRNTFLYDKLLLQRTITDKHLSELENVFQKSTQIEFEPFIARLAQLRKKVDKNKTSWSEVKSVYTIEIERELEKIHSFIGTIEHGRKIFFQLDAIKDLAYAREHLGLLRANIARYYQKKSLSNSELLDITQQYFGFERVYGSFIYHANEYALGNIQGKIETGAYFSVMNQIRYIIDNDLSKFKKTNGWWEESTQVIDDMHKVESMLLFELQKIAEQKQLENETSLSIYLTLATLLFAIVVVMTYQTIARIYISLSNLMRFLKKVETEEDFTIKIPTKSNDEFGQLGFSINRLLDYTAQIITAKEELASKDILTGAMNRRSFIKLYNKEAKRGQRYNTPISLIFCDLDHFKNINDNYGHAMGDNVLYTFSKMIQENIRESDLFARWGGEEFLIMCTDTTGEKAVQLAEKLRELVMQMSFPPLEHITCSFGVAELKENETFDELSERADKAVYEAKNSGRNRVCFNDE